MKKLKWLAIAAALGLIGWGWGGWLIPGPPPSPPPGVNYYVSTTGNDTNDGLSLSTPWLTIQKAMNTAVAGSTVNIRGGTYGGRLTLNVSGTAGNYITFQPYGFSVPGGGCVGHTGVSCGGESVILDYTSLGTNTDSTPLFLSTNRSYVKIQGLVFQNFTNDGPMQQMVRIDATTGNSTHHIEFNYNTIQNSGNIGTWAEAKAMMPFRIWGDNGTATDMVVKGNKFSNLIVLHGEILVAAYVGTSNVTITDNYIVDTDTIGIDIAYGANNFIISNNKLEYAGRKRDGTFWYGLGHIQLYIDGGHTGVIERNYVTQCGGGMQALTELPATYPTHHVTLRSNIITNCSFGMVVGTYYGDGSSVYENKFVNNVLYANSEGIIIKPMTTATTTWANNISVSNTGSNYYNDGAYPIGQAGYNLYFNGNSGPESTKIVADPLFVNASTGNFALQATSPAINAGDPAHTTATVGTIDFLGNARIVGGRVDVGAHERP